MEHHVIQTLAAGALLQSGFQLALADQQQLDILATTTFQLSCGIQYGIQAIGRAVSAGKDCQQIVCFHLFRSPGFDLAGEDAEIATIGHQRDAVTRHTAMGNAIDDARRQAYQPMCRAVARPLQYRHGRQDQRIANDPHGFR
ncbi:hypothetical protein D3C78_962470 [compost metagenome]